MVKPSVVAVMLAVAAPAFAQSGATQSPPAPNASTSAPTPPTSAPPGAMTMNPASSPYVTPGTTAAAPAK